jgi:hypothetical protein
MTTAKKAAAPRKRKPQMTGSESGEAEVTTVVTTAGLEEVVAPDPADNQPEVAGKFIKLDADELKEVALFFQKDVVVADADSGVTKSELLAALASDADGSDAVTWEDYTTLYLPAQAPTRAPVEQRAAGRVDAEALATIQEVEEVETDEKMVLIKMERKNPRFDAGGFTFTHAHPFHSVPVKTAEYIIQTFKGFRIALPSEVQSYYK